MAKYRNIETGDVVNDAKEGTDYLCEHNHCKQCPIHDYVHERNPICTDKLAEEAFVKLYKECGFELINEEKEEESKNHNCRIAEILGVEEDQEWAITGGSAEKIYRIHNGVRQWSLYGDDTCWYDCGNEAQLVNLINNPDLIQPIPITPKWTEREIEIVKAWKTMNPFMTKFTINAFGNTEFEIDGITLSEDPEKCPNFFTCNAKDIEVSDVLGKS